MQLEIKRRALAPRSSERWLSGEKVPTCQRRPRRADARQKNRLRAECRRENRRLAGKLERKRERERERLIGEVSVVGSHRGFKVTRTRFPRDTRTRDYLDYQRALRGLRRERRRLVIINRGNLPRALDASISARRRPREMIGVERGEGGVGGGRSPRR